MNNIMLAQAIGLDDIDDPPDALYVSQDLNFFLVANRNHWAERVTVCKTPYRRMNSGMWNSLQEEGGKAIEEIKQIINAHPNIIQ